jgi:hypothetical protein
MTRKHHRTAPRQLLLPPPQRPRPAWPLLPPPAPPELEQLAAIAAELGRPWI